MNEQLTCGFIGLGLIGGSIARALRKFHPECRLLAYDINKQALMDAVSDGVINTPLEEIGGELAACDYLFLCAPVSENDSYLSKIQPFLSSKTLLTDVDQAESDKAAG